MSSLSESFAIERVFANIDVIVVGVGHDAAILEPWNRLQMTPLLNQRNVIPPKHTNGPSPMLTFL